MGPASHWVSEASPNVARPTGVIVCLVLGVQEETVPPVCQSLDLITASDSACPQARLRLRLLSFATVLGLSSAPLNNFPL